MQAHRPAVFAALCGALSTVALCAVGSAQDDAFAVNYVVATQRLHTAGQPPSEQLATVAERGFDLVINLAPPTVQDAVANEGHAAGQRGETGASYLNIPVEWQVWESDLCRLRAFQRGAQRIRRPPGPGPLQAQLPRLHVHVSLSGRARARAGADRLRSRRPGLGAGGSLGPPRHHDVRADGARPPRHRLRTALAARASRAQPVRALRSHGARAFWDDQVVNRLYGQIRINIAEAKAHFSRYVESVERGKTVTVCAQRTGCRDPVAATAIARSAPRGYRPRHGGACEVLRSASRRCARRV